MKTLPTLLAADLQAGTTTLAYLFVIEQADGVVIRGTNHDMDITIPASGDSPPDRFAGTYRAMANVTVQDVTSNTDLTVDNTELEGAFADRSSDSPQQALVIDVSAAAAEAGLLDMAPLYVLVCNWAAPAHGYWIEKAGTLGKLDRDSDGKYTTELRGLTQLLSQTIIRTYSSTCNVVRFGDHRCKFDLSTVTLTGQVASGSTIDQKAFSIGLDSTPIDSASFIGGLLTFTSGANAGLFREVKLDPRNNGGVITFWEAWPEPINLSDEFSLVAGCDRTFEQCTRYGNTLNNRAFGRFIPGILAITAGPTTPSGLG